jgi:hypothetical protein
MTDQAQFTKLATAATALNAADAATCGVYPMDGFGRDAWLKRIHVVRKARDAAREVRTWGGGVLGKNTFREMFGGAANYSSAEQRRAAIDLIASRIPSHIDTPVNDLGIDERDALLTPVIWMLIGMEAAFAERANQENPPTPTKAAGVQA